MFSYGMMEGEELLHNLTFKGHASRFMQAVGAVVDNIENTDEDLDEVIKTLGKQHKLHADFKVEYFDVFKQAMVEVWKDELGNIFTMNTKEAWCLVFNYLREKMQAGYDEYVPADAIYD